jgi:hypothetical protein
VPFLDPARKRSQALLQMHRADALAVLGDQPAALEGYLAAAGLFRQWAAEGSKRDYANEGKVLVGQAEVLAGTDPRRARALLEEALPLFQADGRAYQEAKAREALGDLGGGGGAWQAALGLYERLGLVSDADRVRAKLQ